MDNANISNPKVNRGCAPLTANRTSADCVQISLGPSIPYIPLGVYHTGRFNAMRPIQTIVMHAQSIHYDGIIMSTVAYLITGVSIICSTVCSGADQRKHQSSTSLVCVRGIHRWPLDSPHKGTVTRKKVPIWWRHHVFWDMIGVMGWYVADSRANRHLCCYLNWWSFVTSM